MTNLLVLADSLSFHGPVDALPADDPRLWPNIAAAALDGHAELFARFGWTSRDAWWAVTGDPRLWAALATTDVLVLAVGSMDTAPSPLPTPLREGLRYVRPPWLRRRLRDGYLAAQPHLARATGGRPVALPAKLTVHYLGRTLHAIRAVRPGLPAVGVVPAIHRAASFGYVHGGHAAAVAAVHGWAARADVPLLDLPALTGPHIRAGQGNPDGMHWAFSAHNAVGEALADLVRPLLR